MKPDADQPKESKPFRWRDIRWREYLTPEYMNLKFFMHLYSIWAVRYPYRCLFVIFTLCGAMAAGTIGSGSMALNAQGAKQWDVKGNTQTLHGYALNQAQKDLQAASSPLPRSLTADGSTLYFVFEAREGGDLLNPQNLEVVRTAENFAYTHPKYPDYCELSYTGNTSTCQAPNTVLKYFFEPIVSNGNFAGFTDVLKDGKTFDQLKSDLLASMQASNADWFFFANDYPASGKSKYLRSSIDFGSPLPGISTDDEDKAIYTAVGKDVETDLLKFIGAKAQLLKTAYMDLKHRSVDGVQVLWFSGEYYSEEFGRAPTLDFSWVIFSVICVYIYMYYHTRSVLVVIFSLIVNMLAFPVAHFIYCQLNQVTFFNILHLLLMFIILGISADGFFVVCDAFSQSAALPGIAHDLEKRISYTSQRAATSLMVTSGVTMASFFVIAVTPIVPIAAFGIYAGFLINVLYMLTITVLPPILVIWSTHFEDTPCCPLFRSKAVVQAAKEEAAMRRLALSQHSTAVVDTPVVVTANIQVVESKYTKDDVEVSTTAGSSLALGKSPIGSQSSLSADTPTDAAELSDKPDILEDKLRLLERFFHGPIYNFVKKYKYAIVVVFMAVYAVGIAFTSMLQPPTKSDIWFPNTHLLQKASNELFDNALWQVASSDQYTQVYLLWGIKTATKSSNLWKFDGGDPVYDPAFDPTTPMAQNYLRDVCAALKVAPCNAKGCDFPTLVQANDVKCWTDGFSNYLTAKYPSDNTKRLGSLDSATFLAELIDWHTTDADARSIYFNQVGLFPDVSAPSGYDLRFLAFKAKSTLEVPNSVQKVRSVIKAWTDFLNGEQFKAPAGLRTALTTDGASFIYSATQTALVSSAHKELGIIFPLAFVVINLTVNNLWVSLATIAAIGGIVTTTMGIGVKLIMGWSLGTAESIVIVLLVGYAMDYVLYIAKAYTESKQRSRYLRARESLTHLGVSVFAGTVSNLFACMFLFGCTFTFFLKFAFLIVFATPCAFLWSVLFLPAVLMIVGPEGDAGEWDVWFRKLLAYMRSKKEKKATRSADSSTARVVPVSVVSVDTVPK